VTAYTPVYRLVVYQPRSQDPNEAIALTPVAGAPHTDYLKVTTGPAAAGPTKPTAAMLSHSGMTVFTAANCIDGNLANTGWGTDSAVSGATLQVDLGAGAARRYRICRIYTLAGAYAGIYDVEYSDNGSAWSKAFTGFTATAAGWNSCVWQDVGAHRYWRLLLTNTPGAGPELAELELWEVDGPGDWKPYLLPLESGRRGKVDVRNKTGDTGVMSFTIVDPQLPGVDPLSRFLPAFLGDIKGQLRVGGLKVRVFESLDGGTTFTSFWAGRLRTLEQETPIRYSLAARELSDDLQALAFVGRPHPAVTYAGVMTLLPVGSITAAYGTQASVASRPATSVGGPLKGTVVSYTPYPKGRRVVLNNASRSRTDNYMTQNLLEACPLGDENLFARNFAGTARVRLKRLDTQAVGYFRAAISLAAPWALYGSSGLVRVGEIGIGELGTNEPDYMAFPPDSTSVEVWIEAEQEATEETPILIGDVHLVALWRDLLRGYFGFRWTPPETLPPGKAFGDPRLPIPINEAKFTTLVADTRYPTVRFPAKKRVPRGRWIQDKLLRAGNLAYYFDGDGVLNPVDLRTPTDVSSVPTITDADLALGAPKNWEYDRGRAITRVDAAYYTDYPKQQTELRKEAGTTLGSLVFPAIGGGGLDEVRHPVTILDLGNSDLGDEPFDLDIEGFRSMEGESLGGQPRATYLERRLIDLAVDSARPFGVGAPTLPLDCRRGSAGDALPGEVRKISIRSVPDPATNKLGGTRVVRVVERQEKKGFVHIVVMDLGLPTVAGVPTLGAPAQESGNTADGVTVNVTLNGNSDPVEMHYAVTDTSVGVAPAEGSALWTPIASGLVRASGDVSFRGLPAGKRVWRRGRSFPDVRVNYSLPSAWVAASSIDLATLAAPSAPAASLQTARSFRVSWTYGSADLATELLIATPTSDPRVVVARVPPGSTLFDFPGDTGLLIQPSTTYRVGVRHTDGVDSVSAEVTVDPVTTAVEPVVPPISIQPRPFGKVAW
jgi:hypothetical protein